MLDCVLHQRLEDHRGDQGRRGFRLDACDRLQAVAEARPHQVEIAVEHLDLFREGDFIALGRAQRGP